MQDLSHHEFPAQTIAICARVLEDPDAYAKSLLDRPVANTAEGNVIHAAEETMMEGFRQKEREEAKKRSEKKSKKDVGREKSKKHGGKKKLAKKPTKNVTSPKSLIDERTERKTTTKDNCDAGMKTPANLSMSSDRMIKTLNPPGDEDDSTGV